MCKVSSFSKEVAKFTKERNILLSDIKYAQFYLQLLGR